MRSRESAICFCMSDPKPTDVDEALRAAKANPHHANFFYDAFLNAEMYIPVLRADKEPGDWKQLKISERFFPLCLRQGEVKAVPVFDRVEKLKAWADEKAYDYLVLQAHLLLKVIAPEMAIILNENTPDRYYFTPEILQSLRDAVQPVNLN